MNNEQLEILRTRLLLLADRSPAGASLDLAAVSVGGERAELRRELDYLADKGFLAAGVSRLNGAVRNWRITAAGRDLLAEENL